jgi:hypothetical protein
MWHIAESLHIYNTITGTYIIIQEWIQLAHKIWRKGRGIVRTDVRTFEWDSISIRECCNSAHFSRKHISYQDGGTTLDKISLGEDSCLLRCCAM